MAIGLRAAGAWSFGINSFAPAIPAAQVTGDMMILVATGKPYDSGMSVATSGWASLGSGASGTTAAGVDTGSMKLQVWYKEATSDTEINPTITEGTPTWNVMGGVVYVMSKGASETWSTPVVAFGADETSGTAISVTFASDPGGAAGDYVVLATGINTDAMGPLTTDLTPAWTGITFGTADAGIEGETTSGGDMAGHIMSRPVSSGTSSAAPTATGTGTASGGADRLEAVFIRLRVATNYTIVTQDIQLGITEDNTTITQNHVVATQDIQLGLTEDNATITQNHILATQDVQLGITEDDTTVSETHLLSPNDISLSMTEDNTTITQNHVISVADAELGLTTDSTTITQNHVISVQDISLGLNTDNTTITQNYTIVVQDVQLSIEPYHIDQQQLNSSSNSFVGFTASQEKVAQSFQLTDIATNANLQIYVKLRKVGSPTDGVVLKLYTDSASAPNALIATSQETVNGADLGTGSYTEHRYTFLGVQLTTATTYWFEISRTGATSETDYYRFSRSISTSYSAGAYITYNGTSWSAPESTTDIYFSISDQDSTNLTQNHAVAANDIELGITSDNTTVDQTNFILTTQDLSLGLTTDNTSLIENYNIVVNDTTLGLNADNSTITQNHIIVTQDSQLGITLDNTTVVNENDTYILNTADLELGITVDNTTLNLLYTLATNDIELGIILDNLSINQNHLISAVDIALGLELNTTTVAVAVILGRNIIELTGTKKTTNLSGSTDLTTDLTGTKPYLINISGEK